jgi:hypothetical protein
VAALGHGRCLPVGRKTARLSSAILSICSYRISRIVTTVEVAQAGVEGVPEIAKSS